MFYQVSYKQNNDLEIKTIHNIFKEYWLRVL